MAINILQNSLNQLQNRLQQVYLSLNAKLRARFELVEFVSISAGDLSYKIISDVFYHTMLDTKMSTTLAIPVLIT